MKLDQIIKNLTCGDLEIPLVMIGLEVTRLKKIGLCTSLICLGEGRDKGWCDFVCVERL